eukprot:gene4444-5455_t
MDQAATLMQLNWVIRRAVCLINGLEIAISDDTFTLTVLSVIPWFKVVERYPLTGETKMHSPKKTPRTSQVSDGSTICIAWVSL